jgi:hypothetical protein
MTENTNHTPMRASEAIGNAPMAAADTCEHAYCTRILGGHPLHVRSCILCRVPDWDDLMEQAEELYRWGWEEGRAGQEARTKLSAYDRPTPKEDRA